MVDFLYWLIAISLIGWLAFPICYHIFGKALDRGYSFSKVVGMLLWGYIYWIGNSWGVLTNNLAGAISAILILGAASFLFTRKAGFSRLWVWVKDRRNLLIAYESVFVIAFLGWAIVRAANPEISGTEKPMELAFINAIARSPAFPPNDPWLSGYAISYYYFGYLITAAMMQLTGTISGTAFNLAISLTFGLTAAGSWGILVNLLARKSEDIFGSPAAQKKLKRIMRIALLAPVFLLILGNAEGFLEMLHARGLFWDANLTVSRFWQWLDIQDLTNPPALPLSWNPGRLGGTWWWRGSRVLQDYTVSGQSREIIDEFPFFSYLLADLHPHVLAMPAVLLAIYSAFYIFMHSFDLPDRRYQIFAAFRLPHIWFLAFTTGSLIFLNTWDFPIYFGLIALAYIIPVIHKKGWKGNCLQDFLTFVIPFGVMCVLLFLPFLTGLSSQAGGFLPSLVFHTRAVHFFVMFFPLLIPTTLYILTNISQSGNLKRWLVIFLYGLIATCALFLAGLAIPAAAANLPRWLPALGNNALQNLLGIFGAADSQELIFASLREFITNPWLIIFLVAVSAALVILIFTKHESEDTIHTTQSYADRFVWLVMLTAVLLALVPEFFYLRDQFGWRMNTIFKFYFQVWILLAIAGAYAAGNFLFVERGWRKSFLVGGVIIAICTGLAYPIFAIKDKTNSFRNIEWSVDGNYFYEVTNPQDNQAIQFLGTLPYGTVAEAIGGSYSGYGRVSRLSGYPTVLGWPGHELQWRGGSTEIGSRESDLRLLYETDSWETARWVLDQYQIDYIFLGTMERNTYQVHEEKFNQNLAIVFKNDEVVIYSYAG
jgi:YYY domain-containing protein